MKQLGMPKAAEYGLPSSIGGLLGGGSEEIDAATIGSGRAAPSGPPSGSGGSGTSTGAQLPSGPPTRSGERACGTDGAGNVITYVGGDDGKNGFVWVPAR